MENKIRDLRQQLLNFEFSKSLSKNDFFVSDSNFYAYNLLLSWPKWEKKIINIFGERYSGKTHLIEIFLEKNKGLKLGVNELKNYDLDSLKADYYKKNIKEKSKKILNKIRKLKNYGKKNSLKS